VAERCAAIDPEARMLIRMAALDTNFGPVRRGEKPSSDQRCAQFMAAAVGHLRDGAWWRGELQRASSPFERTLAVFCAASWLQGETLRAVMPSLNRSVNALSPEDFSFVASSVSQPMPVYRTIRLRRDAFTRLSPRLAALLAYRDESAETAIWRSALVNYKGSDPLVLVAGAQLGATCARSPEEWEGALRLMAAAQRRDVGLRTYRLGTIPPAVARRVVEEAPAFPLHLVLACERVLQVASGRRLPPVATLAKADRWFARDR
jgi:hypothetical protein